MPECCFSCGALLPEAPSPAIETERFKRVVIARAVPGSPNTAWAVVKLMRSGQLRRLPGGPPPGPGGWTGAGSRFAPSPRDRRPCRANA